MSKRRFQTSVFEKEETADDEFDELSPKMDSKTVLGFTLLPFSSYIFITVEYSYSISLVFSLKASVSSICSLKRLKLLEERPFTMVDIISVIILLL